MNIAEVAAVTKNLLNQKTFHTEKAGYYNALFNSHFTGGPVRTVYTKLEKFYQRMTQYHLSEVFKVEVALGEFTEIVDVE